MINTVIFDLGGVLIDWNPRYLYRKIFNNENEADHFLTHICTSDWNEEQDAGRPVAQATEELVARYPEFEQQIRAFYGRWEEMLGGVFEDSVAAMRELKQTEHRLYALTNWSAETFPIALRRYDFLHWFDGVVMSGEEKTRKPFPDFYKILLSRYNVEPSQALFLDDNLRNVIAAKELGINAVHLPDPAQTRQVLRDWKVLL